MIRHSPHYYLGKPPSSSENMGEMVVSDENNMVCSIGLPLVCKVTRGNFDRWGTLTPFSFQHFQLNVQVLQIILTGNSTCYHLGS